ncbi:MAG: L,D-transpeptidase/peptidoglycan binding protein [Lachnospiraceae bacterium]|nr:L,D-transpeptidase/peptidoglycan binding protein [Lachnospiraceae bacterium]
MLIILAVIAVAYFAAVFFFSQHFFPNTKIGGVDYSYKSPEEAEQARNTADRSYTITLNGRNDARAVLSSDSVGFACSYSQSMLDINKLQNPFAWPLAFFQSSDYTPVRVVSCNEASIESTLASLDFLKQENMEEPQNAYLGGYDEDFGAYVIEPEKEGTELDLKLVIAAVKNCVMNEMPSVDLDAFGCYAEPLIKSDDPELNSELARMNKFSDADITYEFGDELVEVNFDQIHNWVDVTEDTVSVDRAGVAEFVEQLAEEHDTYGLEEEFLTVDGRTVTLPKGKYGWKIDTEAETDLLIEDIEMGRVVSREPVVSNSAVQWGANDIGDTYIEINMTKQRVYYIEHNNIEYECDCVTGNVSNGNRTPEGIFGVTYKTKNAILRGDGYESHVNYWMPFNRNIGLHDATWRGKFGGEIYKTRGSHGCVNLPKASAAYLYDKVEQGFPVICYYLEDEPEEEKEEDNKASEKEKLALNTGSQKQNGSEEQGAAQDAVPTPAPSLTGDATVAVTGDTTGNVTGDATGTMTGDATGAVTGQDTTLPVTGTIDPVTGVLITDDAEAGETGVSVSVDQAGAGM